MIYTFPEHIRAIVAERRARSSVISFYSGIGVLVKRGLIDVTLVDDLMVGSIVALWGKMEPVIMDARERWNWPEIGEHFEYRSK